MTPSEEKESSRNFYITFKAWPDSHGDRFTPVPTNPESRIQSSEGHN